MPSKSLLARGYKAEAEAMAIHFRQELGISKFDPLDAFQLANFLDVPIFTLEDAFGQAVGTQFYRTLAQGVFNAIWIKNEDGDKVIIHNSKHSEYRQQSNLMHELAHIIRKHEVPEDILKLNIPLDLHYYNPLFEQEAKYLGGCLQITRPGLQWAIKRMDEVEMSKYYKASLEMVQYRLNITGVLKQWRNKSHSY